MKFKNEHALADAIIAKVGKKISLAIPLGAGKPNHIVNALFLKAQADSSIQLEIYTALTLNKPTAASLLEKKFLQPFVDRVFGDYPNLLYEEARLGRGLPANVTIFEFYFRAGKHLHNRKSQENYISCNYTHVARDLIDRGVNVVAQLVSPSKDETTFSLSCNPDVTLDIMEHFEKHAKDQLVVCAQVNRHLPFMYGDAVVPISRFDFVLDDSRLDFKIFAPPKMSVSYKDYVIGLYASTLIKDGGELQVGIGSLGDAIAYSLVLRHQKNAAYLNALNEFKIINRYDKLITKFGGSAPFTQGLFAASEMFVDSFMHLINADILKRRVYDNVILQRLINQGVISEIVTPETLYQLIKWNAVQAKLSNVDFSLLRHFGILRRDLNFKNGFIIFPDGKRIDGDLNIDVNLKALVASGLGDQLRQGAVAHGGFFLGCQEFYDWLHHLPDEKRRQIHMKSVTKINQLYGHEELDRLHRQDARFVNTCLKMTISGAAASDGLENNLVISGVGGQYNFVAMAHALKSGKSIIQLRSTRTSAGGEVSNIVFNYGHITIPRHLRDVVITEYGIAELRGKTDSEVAAALIEIADSRFQEKLVMQAKAAGKLSSDYQIPLHARHNTPSAIRQRFHQLKSQGLFPDFPFGTDFTDEEIHLASVLKSLKYKSASKPRLFAAILKSLTVGTPSPKESAYLKRMGLLEVKSMGESLYRRLLLAELRSQ
jgi:acyl-CoA hydrolase